MKQTFFDLVILMREAQKEYFKTRDKKVLEKSKYYERLVDQAILTAKNPSLFGGEIAVTPFCPVCEKPLCICKSN